MALTHVQEIKWAGTLQGLAQEASIIASVTDGTYASDANGAKIVRVTSVNDVTVAPYVAGSLTYPALTDSEIDIPLDQKNVFTFSLEDIDASQTSLDVKSFATQRAAKKIILTADAYAFSLHAGAGFEINDGATPTPGALAINSANIEDVILRVAQYFDEQNVDSMDRNLVVLPWFKNKLIQAGLARAGANSDAMYLNGFIGEILGFKVYVSNQLAAGHMLAMTSRAIAYAGQINKVESLRLQDSFADAVRGLLTFGAKVVKSVELVDIWCSAAAEA